MSGSDSLVLPAPQRRPGIHSADGTRLNVEIFEPRTGPPTVTKPVPTVVLCHGWTSSIVIWARQINALTGDGVRVVAYDQRGHGASSRLGPAGATHQALADDLAAVLEGTLAPGQQAVLAGHSMGAMSMVALAARHPEQFRHQVGAALIASTGMHELMIRGRLLPMPLPLAKLAKPMSSRVMGMSAGHTRITPVQRAMIKYGTLSSTATDAEVDFCARMDAACPPRTRAEFARMLSRLNLDREVARFDVPTIVVAGTHDRLTPIWHARRLAARLPRLIELVEVAGAGHMTPIQSAAEVNAALTTVNASLKEIA